MPLVESLTVQILGDSSGLEQELNSVADLLEGLQQQLAGASEGAAGIGNAFGGLASALAPLQALSSELGIISQQIQQLAGQPVSLNVQPALEALNLLMQNAQAAAAQLAMLSSMSLPGLPTGFPGGISGGTGGMTPMPPRAYAEGGIVTGPSGIDEVPARLTAGEFVLNRNAVAALGAGQLDRWNRGIGLNETQPSGLSRSPEATIRGGLPTSSGSAAGKSQSTSNSLVQQTMNHFGGIEIHVQETADVSEVLQDLRRQGISTRHRWG